MTRWESNHATINTDARGTATETSNDRCKYAVISPRCVASRRQMSRGKQAPARWRSMTTRVNNHCRRSLSQDAHAIRVECIALLGRRGVCTFTNLDRKTYTTWYDSYWASTQKLTEARLIYCTELIIIITTTMFTVLSSWPKSLREFTRFIWWMQTECGWPPTLRPSQSTWAVSPPKIGSYHPHPPSPLLLLLSPKADTHFTVQRKVEGWVHCNKGAQPVPKAVYRNGYRDRHNCLRRDSNLGPRKKGCRWRVRGLSVEWGGGFRPTVRVTSATSLHSAAIQSWS